MRTYQLVLEGMREQWAQHSMALVGPTAVGSDVVKNATRPAVLSLHGCPGGLGAAGGNGGGTGGLHNRAGGKVFTRADRHGAETRDMPPESQASTPPYPVLMKDTHTCSTQEWP
jgi:hypothetical protein